MPSLYTLDKEYQEALQAMDGMDEEAVANTLEGMQGEIKQKMIAVAAFIANLELDVDNLTTVEKRIQDRKKAAKNKAVGLRKYLIHFMQKHEVMRVQNEELYVKVNKPRKVVFIDDIEVLPESYLKWSKSADKTAIKKAIDNGEEIKGAHIGEGDASVLIK